MRTIRLIANFALILLLIFLLSTSCTINNEKNKWTDVNPMRWHQASLLNFSFNIPDSLQYYNLIVGLRNESNYPFRNLWLFIEGKGPDNTINRDTFECFLSSVKGNWYGRGWGSTYSLKVLYRENVKFYRPGTYNFTIQHGMRDEKPIKGIRSVGMLIQKKKN